MKAYRCDRCGAYFGNPCRAGMRVVKTGFNDYTQKYDYTESYDLCKDCQNSLNEWWKNVEKKEVEDDRIQSI